MVAGNVGRFLNHRCEPNCGVTPVQTYGEGTARSSSLCYRIAIFAQRNIPAMQELTYDYGECHWAHQGVACISGQLLNLLLWGWG